MWRERREERDSVRCERESVCVCVERERERECEGERERVCVCVCEREGVSNFSYFIKTFFLCFFFLFSPL